MGCFNMSCAITGTPILIGEPVVVAIAVEAEQMRSVILPMHFKAEYNDYGTVEDFDPDDPCLQWYMKFVGKEAGVDVSGCIRDLIEGGSELVKFDIENLPVSNPRAVLIHEHAWNKIIRFKKHACDSRYLYHNPQEQKSIYDVLAERFESNERLAEIKSKQELSDEEQLEYKELEFKSFVESIGSSGPEFLKGQISAMVNRFREQNNWSIEKATSFFGDQFEQATLFSRYAVDVHSHLITRYASQDTNDAEQELLISLMQERMELMRQRYEE